MSELSFFFYVVICLKISLLCRKIIKDEKKVAVFSQTVSFFFIYSQCLSIVLDIFLCEFFNSYIEASNNNYDISRCNMLFYRLLAYRRENMGLIATLNFSFKTMGGEGKYLFSRSSKPQNLFYNFFIVLGLLLFK